MSRGLPHLVPCAPPPAPAINWSRSVSCHGGGGHKANGLPEAHSKFRPVKRVSPLKHQPETTEPDSDGKGPGEAGERGKEDHGSDKPTSASTPCDGSGVKADGPDCDPQALLGELEHYDLDMDEILDVPYIKSSQQMSTLTRVPHDKRSVTGSNLGGGTLERSRGGGLKGSALTHSEALSLGGSSSQTQVRTDERPQVNITRFNDICIQSL